MSPEHVSTIRRNQEQAVKHLYLAMKSHGPDPERVARETDRLVEEMAARERREASLESWLTWLAVLGLYLVFVALIYWAVMQ